MALSIVPKDGKMTFLVRLDSIDLMYNESVGNEWSFAADIDGTKVAEGKEVEVVTTPNDNISVDAVAEEYDSVPDIGGMSRLIDIRDLQLDQKNIYPIEVTVTENKDRYSGNTAKWEV